MTEGEVQQATCQVIGTSEAGTGWLISADQILSAYHCLGEAVPLGTDVEVSFGVGPSAVKHKAKLEVLDADLDVCVLRLPASTDAAPLPLAVSAPRPGTRWNAFGYPVAKLQIGQVLDGTVQQALSELANGIDLDLSVSAETTLSDYRGMSGAALMTADGCQGLLRVSVDNSLGAVSMAALRGFLSDNNLLSNEGASEDDTSPFAERPTFDETFESSLSKTGRGYLFLDGAHGIGKSTYCKNFRPDSNDIEVLGVYAFSERSRGSTAALQAQPEVFVDWLTSLLSVLATGRPARLSQATYAQLVQTTHQTLQSLAQHCANDGKVGVLFIDGVNEAATIGDDVLQRFIGLLPTTIPQGLQVVIVGAGLDAIAGKLAPIFQPVHRLTLPVLDDSIQYSLCTSTLDQDKVSPALVAALCERAKGHPLYLRYLVDIVNGGAGEEDLESLPPFSGAIEDYYETIWAQLLTDADAVNLLGIIARLRWGIPTSNLLVMLTPPESAAFVPTITRIRHLLTAPDTTEVYHSSFSDFVVHKTSAQSVWVQGRLADYCQLPDSGNYGQLNRVFHGLLADRTRQLAAIDGCQQQWVDQSVLLGAEPDVLLGDIEDSLEAATRLATATEIVRLLLLSQRLKFRYDTLFAQSASLAAEALIALGKTDQALRHILRHGHLIVEHSSAFSIVRLLIEAGHPKEAIEVLQKVDSLLQPTLTRNGVKIGEFLNAAAIRLQGWVLADQAGAEPPTADFLEYVVGLVTASRNRISPQNAQRILGDLVGNMLGTSLCIVHAYKPIAQIPLSSGVPNKFQVLSLLSILGHAYNHAQSYKVRLPRDKVGVLLEDISSKLDASLDAEEKQFDFVDLLIETGASPSLVETYAGGLEWEAGGLPLFTQHRSLADSAAFFDAYGRLRAEYFLGRDEYQPAPEALLAYDWEDSLETLAASVAWVDAKARHASASSNDAALADARTYLKEDLLPCLQLNLASRISWQGTYFIPENIVPLLYGYLANLYLDCMPEALTDLLAILEDSFDGQLGLYNEGFRHVMQAVVPRLVNTEVSEDVADRVFDLLIRWRNYVRDNVENRHELVPELLSIVPLLARMKSEEEALQTYQTVLAVSMGPSWYKEDQFAIMSKTLEVLPATAEIAPAALAQIAAYLEHASGEMTFQRYVRSEKATFIGELSRRGMYSDAVRYFQHQACGSIDEMRAQASHGGLDRVAPLVGMRFPGGALDEQASLVSLLEHIGTAANWRVRWALLEVYLHGDERYLRDWGRAYAKLIQEIAPSSVDLEWAVKRISSIAQAMNDERAWMLLSCLNEALPDTTRDSFSALFERYRDAFEPDDLESLSRRSGIPMGPSPAKAQAAAEPKTEATASPTEEESLEDRVVMRGTFGTRVSVRAAEQSMEEARKHLKRRNTSAAVEHAMSALRAVQDGGWSIWSKGHPARMADLLIQDNVRSADELARLYGPLALREQHAQSWSVAYQLMELVGPNLDATQRTQLLSVATDHVRELVGAAPSDAFAYIGAKTSATASDALLELLLWALDHPSWERRDSAAAMVLWLLRSDDIWMEKVAPLAFSMESGNRADIAAAALDVLSRESAATLWERVLRFIDINKVTKGCAHASRYVTLIRIANRASSKGIASATDAVKTLRAKTLRSESPIVQPEDTLHAAHVHSSLAAAWRELQSFGVLDEAALIRIVSVLRELCGQHSFDDAQQLESLAAARFKANANFIPDRWAARLRFALNIALFGPASIEQLVKIEAVLRMHNPESLIEPPDGRQLIASLIETIASGDFARFLPSAADLVFLDVQGYLEHRRQIVRVDLTSHLLSPGQRDPHPVELGTFRPTELPRPLPRDQVAVCSRVKPGLAHFGSLTPSIANPQFHELLHAPTSATVRYHWRDGSTVRTPGASRPHEISMLAIQREALTLPPGWRLQWILRVNGSIHAKINKAH
ncbi:AVAST type 1 anti-phage system protease Avs1b [Ectopseudomonas guguanensis]|uniref:Trypsin-like peptidase domain-containing protein n=1 Tax=Ectopseudomonas guguanensis TaxID=1198456 RepID=A0A1H0X7Z8_9GAMM|nr:AVAST type 1 anti-phage system protease Avs1b [Pseudomonas guguanensis]SDP98596.1 Trypsin-like peptidase domain-containing protein [Pseudomonas guguanensis]